MRRRAIATMCGVTALALFGACGDDNIEQGSSPTPPISATVAPTAPPQVAIAAVHERFEYYIACRDVPVEVDGVTYSPLLAEDEEALDESRYEGAPVDDADADDAADAGEAGDVARVMPPGPGDDIGTLVVYADGLARYESDSGQSVWLTDVPVTYPFVC